MSVCICTMLVGDSMRRSGEMSIEINRRYADRHGYGFSVLRESLDSSKTPHWSKLLMLRNAISDQSGYDWLFWIDCDAVFTDFGKSIEDVPTGGRLLTMANENRNMASDRFGENTGVMLLRNDARLIEFIDDCMSLYPRCKDSCVFEQQAVAYALEMEKWGGLWNRVRPRTLNSYHGPFADGLGKPWCLWRPGDFVMHCLRSGDEYKISEFGKVMDMVG